MSYDGFAGWLEARLDHAAALDPDPGRSAVFHRLNRAEYANAIRDLLALEIDATELLPADDASYGFDNIAASLRMSPTRVRLPVAAGVHEVAATFLENGRLLSEATRTNTFARLRLALVEPSVRAYAGGYFNDETRSGPYLAHLTVTGPFLPSGPGDTESRQRIFTCRPTAPEAPPRSAAADRRLRRDPAARHAARDGALLREHPPGRPERAGAVDG